MLRRRAVLVRPFRGLRDDAGWQALIFVAHFQSMQRQASHRSQRPKGRHRPANITSSSQCNAACLLWHDGRRAAAKTTAVVDAGRRVPKRVLADARGIV
jgi:hypothetical protein